MTTISIKKVESGLDLDLPFYATTDSAGMDLLAAIPESITLKPGERAVIPCGFALALPTGYEAQIRPRSGLAAKHGLTVLNAPGTIDADYRGEVKALMINLGQEDFTIERGLRVAQFIIAPYTRATWNEVSDFDSSESTTTRGTGGFGSTGTQLKKSA